jgi:ParB/RepB/Spo0J family partition protein
MKIGKIVVSNCNARTVVEDSAADNIQNLSNSIEKHQLISRLALRLRDDGVYEVVAGQRRLKALKKIHGGDYELPPEEYVVLDANDDEAYLISLDENLRRLNLSPMDLNRAYLKLNSIGKDDKEISEILQVSPHRLKRLAALSQDLNRIPEEAIAELSKPAGESTFNDLHWSHIASKTDDPDIIKDTVDFIMEHESPAKDVPTILKAVEKNYKQENIDPNAMAGSSSAPDDDNPSADSPIEYKHKGELVIERHGDVETFKVLGKSEDEEVPIEHYLQYLRHPEKFKCYVTFKLVVKPID